MSKKRMFLFMAAIMLLIVSEYLLLNELMGSTNAAIVVGSTGGLVTSVFFIVRFYNEWRNSLK